MALRFIQVGTGGWGACWCREFLPHLIESGRLVPAAVVDRDPGQYRHAMEGYGIAERLCFTDAKEAFEPIAGVYFETTLEGHKRLGHLWEHTHGPAEPQPERV